jgi:large subunit ribosomal protein L10
MRVEKVSIIADVQQKVNHSPFVILVNYAGLKVSEFTELRHRLYNVQSECRVVKNTLLRKALQNENLPDLETHLNGQSAVVIGEKDVFAACKVLKAFQNEFKKPEIRIGILDRNIISKEQVLEFADIPPREVVLGKILGLLQAPASKIAQIIKAKTEKDGGTPAETTGEAA